MLGPLRASLHHHHDGMSGTMLVLLATCMIKRLPGFQDARRTIGIVAAGPARGPLKTFSSIEVVSAIGGLASGCLACCHFGTCVYQQGLLYNRDRLTELHSTQGLRLQEVKNTVEKEFNFKAEYVSS
jgi:hypothetical protein